jgi:lipoyl(octanoyl) transferase
MIDCDQIPVRTTGFSPLTGSPLVIHPMGLGHSTVDYRVAWQLQLDLHEQVASGNRPDTILLLEHNPVFTAGSRTQPSDRPVDTAQVVEVDRGGRITWHGPGQLVGYPIVRLPQRIDVVAYVRALESLVMEVCQDLGVPTSRINGRSGVWVSPGSEGRTDRPNKIAAIGVRVASGVAMHGFALNCDCDLSWSEEIVPCGLSDAGVTSLTAETGRRVLTSTAADVLQRRLSERPTKGSN